MNKNVCNLVANIKTGQRNNYDYIVHKNTKLCITVLNALWDQGYIYGYKTLKSNKKEIIVFLKYNLQNMPAIKNIKIISKPSLKKYFTIKQLWKSKLNQNNLILTTNSGVLTAEECKYKTIGGDLLIILN